MTKPPIQKATQTGYVQSAIRLPEDLRDELQRAAAENGRSMNAEIIARLRESKAEGLAAELAEIKAVLRRILDAVT